MKNNIRKNIPVVNLFKAIILLILFIIPLSVSAQDKKQTDSNPLFTFEFVNTPIKQVFDYIQSKSDYVFLYYGGVVSSTQKVTVKVKKQNIETVLQQLFKNMPVSYSIKDRQIILKKAEGNGKQAVQQRKKKTIRGVVIDESTQDPIIGAAIMVKGTGTGTTSNMDGNFTLQCNEGDSLSISYIGYQDQTIIVKSGNIYAVTLREASEMLGEVVVTAFGVGQKKESVVGSIVQVKPDDLVVPSSNLSNAFAGRLAGVTSFQRSGQPGADGSTFYIRGISTINESARGPLIVIDGVEASTGDLNALDPEVIEGFSILKDATATAMYGTRGANGVMIVNTKSGANMEKAAISFRIEGNVAMPTDIPEFADAPTYMRLFNQAVENYGTGSIPYTQEQIDGVINHTNPYLYPNVDWYNELFKKAAFNQKVNFNVRGGGKRMDYFMNVNVNHETGMLKDRSIEFYSFGNNIDIMRYTFQNNLNLHIHKNSTISLNLGVELRDTHGPAANVGQIFTNVMNNNPVDFPMFYPTSSYVGEEGITSEYVKWGYTENADTGNPLAELTKGYSDSFASTVRANLRFTQKLDFITEGLKFGALVSFKNWASTSRTRTSGYNRYYLKKPLLDENGKVTNLILASASQEQNYNLGTSTSTTGDRTFYIQATLNYDRVFNDIHNVSAMLLYNQDEYNVNNPNNDLISSLPKRKMGVAARLSYDYAHKYMAELNMGYNGSENFAEGHRWGFFPSLALGWTISREKWFEGATDYIHHLKLRGSYGLVGNADAGTRFLYMPVVNLQGSGAWVTGDGEVSSGAIKGPVYSRYENKNITWEVGYKSNVALEIGLFNSLNLTFDYFNELRTDIFQQNNTVPNYFGTANSAIYGNYGEVKNWGFEVTADYGKQITKDLTVQFKGTFSFARNKVLKYAQATSKEYPNLNIIGQSLNKYQGYIYTGSLMTEEDLVNGPSHQISGNMAAGDIRYVDLPNIYGETDGIINDNDRQYLGHPTVPEIIYGFGPSVKWKNWDFSCFFQGVANTSLMMANFHPFGKYDNRNVLQFIVDDFYDTTSENPNIYASYPRLTKLDHANNTVNSTYWLRNAAFLKLKNAEIGYSWKFMRVYVNGSNLLTFSPFKLWDPEMGGGSALRYPTQRVFNVGIQMSFK